MKKSKNKQFKFLKLNYFQQKVKKTITTLHFPS